MASSSAASADVFPQPKYDVFLSFRGEDTRFKFISHLRGGLERKNISFFMDDKSLETGDEIGPALLKAIEQSKISIIIFSKDYASSRWCLDELVYILKCKETYGQLVIPVFYDIDPSHVRGQRESYANLEVKFKDNMEKVSEWKAALKTAANLSGTHSLSHRNEHELVEKITEIIWTKLNRNASYTVKDLVGMEDHIQQIELLLAIQTQEVSFRAIGICGMGGIGKTTLADAVFHRNSSRFHACLFLANVREETEKHGPIHLRNELLRNLLEEKNLSIGSPSIGSSFVKDRLSRLKVLLVLDDVSDTNQLEYLLNNQIQFGHGSRIIITTRNRSLLRHRVREDNIYEVSLLSVHDAVKLFQSIAFKNDSSTPTKDYSSLSEKVVEYAGRLPLALKVLASSFFHCKNAEDWEEEFEKLKKFPSKSIDNVLMVSYNLLEENEKEIFLDVACFYKGEDINGAKGMLEIRGFFASRGIRVLADMFLISIRGNRLEMHDLLQKLGRTIDREIEKCKRWWNGEAYRGWDNPTGISNVEVMFLDICKIRERQLSPTAFRNMHNLQLLKIYLTQEVRWEFERQIGSLRKWPGSSPGLLDFLAKSRLGGLLRFLGLYPKFRNNDEELFQKYCRVNLPGGLESFPEELRYLYWDGCPLQSLPSKYSPENLVELHMPYSQIKQPWSNAQNLRSLKRLNLSHSLHLTEVPDLSGSPNIETVNLSECTSLVKIPSYFQNLENLKSLILSGCRNLTIFGEIPSNLEVLDLCGSQIKELSSSIWCHKKLHTLILDCCFDLKSLPSGSSSSRSKVGDENHVALKTLALSGSVIEEMPDSIYSFSHLESLKLHGCDNLKRWPLLPVGCFSSLRKLDLSWCLLELEILESLICLPSLQDIDLSYTMIERIPSSIINCSGLRFLKLGYCKRLRDIPELPWQLERLVADGCTSLQTVASSSSGIVENWQQYKGPDGYRGEEFSFSGCLALDETARSTIVNDTKLRFMRMRSASSRTGYPYRSLVTYPGNEIPRWFNYQSEGCSISIDFPGTTLDQKCLKIAMSIVVASSDSTFPSDDDGLWRCQYYFAACNCDIKTNDGEAYQFKYDWSNLTKYDDQGDQVSVFFENDLFWRCPIHLNEITHASFHFYPEYYDPTTDSRCEERRLKVKKCGVHLFNNDSDSPTSGNSSSEISQVF